VLLSLPRGAGCRPVQRAVSTCPVSWGDKAEAHVVVPIVGRIVVTVRCPRVRSLVVPTAAAIDAVRALPDDTPGRQPEPVVEIRQHRQPG
jgi:hypothetical protein